MRRFIVLLVLALNAGTAAVTPHTCPAAHCIYIPLVGGAPAGPDATATSTPSPTAPPTPTPTSTAPPTPTPTSTAPPTPTATPGVPGISWSTVANSPLSRSEAQGAVVNGKLYVLGGYTDGTFIPVSTAAHVYDPATDRWTALPPLPRPITHAGTAVDGDTIYLAGGVVGDGEGNKIDAINEVWAYNVTARTWSAMPPLPEPRGAGELALLGRTLHFFGGTGLDRYSSVGDHWTLDLDGGTTWQPAVALPNPRNHLADAVLDGKLYAIGGQQGHNETLIAQGSVHVWDPAQPDRWTPVRSLPVGLSHIGGATFVHEGKIFVLGGETAHGTSVATVYVYDPRLDRWTTTTNLPAARHSGIAGVIDGHIYYTTGSLATATYQGELGN